MRFLFVFMFVILCKESAQQHIFDETCTFTATDFNRTTTSSVIYAKKLVHVGNDRYDVYMNFCGPLGRLNPPDASFCDPKALACIIRKKPIKRRFIANAAQSFRAQGTEKGIVLIASSQATCPDGKFEFRVEFDKKATEDKISESDECYFELTLPHPTVEMRDCAFAYQGLIMDLSPLRTEKEQFIQMGSSKIAIAACRAAPSCRQTTPPASICDISPTGGVSLIADKQHVGYDERTNVLTLRARKQKHKIEMTLNCNWTTTFSQPKKMAARYKYTVESKYGCVKRPLQCHIQDIEHYNYDLSGLAKATGWPVANSNGSSLLINICGTLKNVVGKCAEHYAQVCNVTGPSAHAPLSYGGLTSGFHVDGDDIWLSYTHGSPCPHNLTKYLETNVLLQCANREYGPVLTSMINCTASILWRTPKACTTGLHVEDEMGFHSIKNHIDRFLTLDCRAYQKDRSFNLASLSRSTFTIPSRTVQGVIYHISICRPLPVTGDNYLCGVTGACIENTDVNLKKRYLRVGSLKNPQFSAGNDKQLMIQYNGGYCNSTSGIWEIVIYFNCSTVNGKLTLFKESPCRVEFNWDTPLACGRKTQRDVNYNKCTALMKTSNTELDGELDLSKLTNRQFGINYTDVTYDVDLCEVRQFVFNITACHFTTNYSFTNTIDSCKHEKDEKRLSSVCVNLLCDDIAYNADHLADYLYFSDNCTHRASVTLKTNLVCELLRQQGCQTAPRQAQTAHAYVMAPVKSTIKNVCKVVQDDQVFKIDTLNVSTRYAATNYTINGGCIFKNRTLIAADDVCPSAIIDNGGKSVELNFVGPPCGKAGFYQTKVQIECSGNTVNTFNVVDAGSNTNCSSYFVISGNYTCHLFAALTTANEKTQIQGVNITGLVVGVVVLVIACAALILVAWKKDFLSCKLGEERRSPLLYTKEGSD